MGQTSIEWTDQTWNPIHGCDRVSPGCDHCYALTMARRLKAMGRPDYQDDGDPRTSGPGFAVTTAPNTLLQPLSWQRPRKVFVNSMGDVFHAAVDDTTIAGIWAVMAATPRHTYQLLTKRPARMRAVLNSPGFHDLVDHALRTIPALADSPAARAARDRAPDISMRPMPPLPNVWLGVSTEDQTWAQNRIHYLLRTPAAVRWISAEPLLGPIDLKAAVWMMGSERGHGLTASYVHVSCCGKFHGIDWIVAGGESGPGARPMNPDWARGLRDQAVGADIPFVFKQWGSWAPDSAGVIRRVSKKAAGRELDGRTWDQYPTPTGEATS